jgi:hypothetical protein
VENLYLSFLGGKHIRDVVVVGFVHKVHLVDRSLRQGLLYRHVLVMAQTGALAFAFEKVHHAFDQVLRLVVVTNGHLRNVGGCVWLVTSAVNKLEIAVPLRVERWLRRFFASSPVCLLGFNFAIVVMCDPQLHFLVDWVIEKVLLPHIIGH